MCDVFCISAVQDSEATLQMLQLYSIRAREGFRNSTDEWGLGTVDKLVGGLVQVGWLVVEMVDFEGF